MHHGKNVTTNLVRHKDQHGIGVQIRQRRIFQDGLNQNIIQFLKNAVQLPDDTCIGAQLGDFLVKSVNQLLYFIVITSAHYRFMHCPIFLINTPNRPEQVSNLRGPYQYGPAACELTEYRLYSFRCIGFKTFPRGRFNGFDLRVPRTRQLESGP
jgi:hypothetical protein